MAKTPVRVAVQDPQIEWGQRFYSRWLDDLLRLSRAPDRTDEVRLAAEALFGALAREQQLFQAGTLEALLAQQAREREARVFRCQQPPAPK